MKTTRDEEVEFTPVKKVKHDGRRLYVRPSIPEDLNPYKNSYILVGDKLDKLIYITLDNVPWIKEVNIKDMDEFKRDLLNIDPTILKVGPQGQKCLPLSERVKAIIMSQGGDTPIDAQTQSTFPSTLPSEVLTKITTGIDKSFIDFSLTCKVFYNNPTLAPRRKLAAICERTFFFDRMQISDLEKLYEAHNAKIEKAKEFFSDFKAPYSPENLTMAELALGKEALDFQDLNAIIIDSANNGYFQLLSELIPQIVGFSPGEFTFKVGDDEFTSKRLDHSALFIAAMKGHEKTLALFMQALLDNAEIDEGKEWFLETDLIEFYPCILSSAFHNLALFGHTKLLTWAYEKLLPSLDQEDTFLPPVCADVICNRSIHHSFINRNDDMVLIDYVQAYDNVGWTVVHWAACLGNLVLLKEAVELGAIINAVTDDNQISPLHLACMKNHSECVKYLLGKLPLNTDMVYYDHLLLHIAVDHNSVDSLQVLIKYIQDDRGAIKININFTDEIMRGTALHIACEKNHVQCAQLLVDAGADITLKDIKEKTAFDIAQEEGHEECMKILMKKTNSSLKPF